MNAEIIANTIKSSDKNTRQNLSKLVRTDQEVWNGVHGVGGSGENMPDGKIIGLVKQGATLIPGVIVTAENEDESHQVECNEEGFYSIDLHPGVWHFTFRKEGYYDTIIENADVITGITITMNVEMTVEG